MITVWIGHATRKVETPISLPHIIFGETNVVIGVNKFIEIPANNNSLAKRKLVCGVGINDADYRIKVGNNQCPFYTKWMNMLKRCYDQNYLERCPTYKDCTVSENWLIFSNFKEWMSSQDWEGNCLDKDVLVPGNKIYRPDYCIFVSTHVNSLLTDHRSARGNYPQGVYYFKKTGKFQAYCRINGIKKHLGYFTTSGEAASAYNGAKSEEILRIANHQSDFRIKNALLQHAELRLNYVH